MITIVTIPKAFSGQTAVHQRNAIGSWRSVFPDAQIILCGQDVGVEKAAADLGCEHWADINTTEYGTPLVNAAFEYAEQRARHRLIAVVNADIMFLDDLRCALHDIRMRRFLAVSQRWDLDVDQVMDFLRPNWQSGLREKLHSGGKMHLPAGSDVFVFPRGIPWVMPPFAVGRPGWDNWLIYRARLLVGTVVDMTQAVTLIHQNHGYLHVPAARKQTNWEGPEGDRNLELMGGEPCRFTLEDRTHVMTGRRVCRVLSPSSLEQRMSRQAILDHSRDVWAKLRRYALRHILSHNASIPYPLWSRMVYCFSR